MATSRLEHKVLKHLMRREHVLVVEEVLKAFGVLSAAIFEELVEELKSRQQILLLQEVLDHRRSTVRVQVLLLILFRMN
eukprot:SM000085S23234  [mRNA]  locus=s85:211043:216693:+ [translate_table: standard]